MAGPKLPPRTRPMPKEKRKPKRAETGESSSAQSTKTRTRTRGGPTVRNLWIADRLREAADLLVSQDGPPPQARAYRAAAKAVADLDRDIGAIAAKGVEALDAVAGIGPSIAGAIAELLHTGRWAFLERLRGDRDLERVFHMIPGVGPSMARLLHETLHVDTLEALAMAAAEGRLEQVPGLARRRVGMLRSALGEILPRVQAPVGARPGEPGIEALLEIDAEYRAQASGGVLRRIAPVGSDPASGAGPPVLHRRLGTWFLTALYAPIERIGVSDRVMIYFDAPRERQGHRAIVTERGGALAGRRVVRGRERECLEFYGGADGST